MHAVTPRQTLFVVLERALGHAPVHGKIHLECVPPEGLITPFGVAPEVGFRLADGSHRWQGGEMAGGPLHTQVPQERGPVRDPLVRAVNDGNRSASITRYLAGFNNAGAAVTGIEVRNENNRPVEAFSGGHRARHNLLAPFP